MPFNCLEEYKKAFERFIEHSAEEKRQVSFAYELHHVFI